MIAQLREQAQDLEKRGAQVLLVEPNDAYKIRYLVRRAKDGAERRPRPIDEHTQGIGLWLPSHGEFPWPVVADLGSTAGASYGVAFHGSLDSGELCSQPDTFVIDRDGVLRAIHRYRSTDFLTVDEIVQLLDDLEEKRTLIAELEKTGTELRQAFEPTDLDLRAGAADPLGVRQELGDGGRALHGRSVRRGPRAVNEVVRHSSARSRSSPPGSVPPAGSGTGDRGRPAAKVPRTPWSGSCLPGRSA